MISSIWAPRLVRMKCNLEVQFSSNLSSICCHISTIMRRKSISFWSNVHGLLAYTSDFTYPSPLREIMRSLNISCNRRMMSYIICKRCSSISLFIVKLLDILSTNHKSAVALTVTRNSATNSKATPLKKTPYTI